MAPPSPASDSTGVCIAPASRWGSQWQVVLVFTAALVISLVATSRRSLWIDEAATAVQAMQPTLEAWWQLLLQEKTAHLQMPLYMFYIWGYEKLLGAGEWTLRLSNLPWFVAGAAAFMLGFPKGSRRLAACCVVLLCPFAWYYLDEARPYAMQLGAAFLLMASLRGLAQDTGSTAGREAGYWRLFSLGVLLLCGSHLLGMIWAGAAFAALPLLVSKSRIAGVLKSHSVLSAAVGALLLLLAGYYLWTLKIGARATAPTTSSLGSVLFVVYEVMGFAGFGPGRIELRSAGPPALQGYWIGLALYGAASTVVLGAAILHELSLRDRRHLMLALCAVAPGLFILGVGWMVHFRVLGRHFAPFVAVLLLLFAKGLSALWARRSLWSKGVAVLFCLLSLWSCLSLRFALRHERDNYRAAASIAIEALRSGQPVWWNAAEEGASYYGVPVAGPSAPAGQALLVANPTRESLGALPSPDLIVASKPDLYDGQMALAEYVRERGYREAARFTAFVVWERDRK
jgi:hypothetical protein